MYLNIKYIYMEIWKKIKGFENYEVSNLGRVKSYSRKKERILKFRITKTGYYRVMLQSNCFKKELLIHRLVAIAFLEADKNKPDVNHIDSNKSNNKLENLEWVTKSENIKHSYLIGRKTKSKKIIRLSNPIVIYESIKRASIENNVSESSISQNLRGISKFSNGYKYKYYKE